MEVGQYRCLFCHSTHVAIQLRTAIEVRHCIYGTYRVEYEFQRLRTRHPELVRSYIDEHREELRASIHDLAGTDTPFTLSASAVDRSAYALSGR